MSERRMRLGDKHLDRWLPGWVRHRAERAVRHLAEPWRRPTDLLFCLCDHYEPGWGGASPTVAAERVRAWETRYPSLAARFRDADGRPPRHTFFFPGEQYDGAQLDALGRLARAGLGEVELHLHHDGDTAAALRERITCYLADYARHGHLSREVDGRLRYGFIHGNWALANARRDRRWCGVDGELPVLHQTGCYADFTFPSAPDECQPGIVNRIYWPDGDLGRARCYQRGHPARRGEVLRDRILLVEGPLAPAWRPGTWRPRIEGAALTAADPASVARVRSWVAQGVGVVGRPEWIFVKVHTHGAPEGQAASLLGEGGLALHHALATVADEARLRLHYVTARELFNIAIAAMEGRAGDPAACRDHALPPPPAAS